MAMSNQGLSKLTEEIGELGQVVGKMLAYPDVAVHPDGTTLNSRLEEEMADVVAAIGFVMVKRGLDHQSVLDRVEMKFNLFQDWDTQE